ncbi:MULTISPECIES: hypothetical protein [unclassified Nocardiopsis]|uniref:nitroreductase family protein n=1 Tax=unclassified Nocardiopsis TaxID=2649073 RepID=UPI0013599711|nr:MULTISPECIES: hypothetical protein [unclassified Nocardiopsis]
MSADDWLKEMQMSRRAPGLQDDIPPNDFYSILRLFEQGLMRYGQGNSLNAPSAGGIHPYDAIVFSWESRDRGDTYLVARRLNLHRRSYRVLPVDQEALRVYFPLVEVGPKRARVSYILVLSRPWLSMRKYGKRGYLYAQLDVGHAATALLGTAQEVGMARLSIHIPRPELRKILADFIPHREMHSVLSVCVPSQGKAEKQWSSEEEQSIFNQGTVENELESYSWDFISQYLLPEDTGDGSTLGEEAAFGSVSDMLHEGPPLRDWRKLSSIRRSCTGFADGDLPHEKIETLLSVLSVNAESDIREDAKPELGMAVVMPSGLIPAARPLSVPDEVSSVVQSDFIKDEHALTRACNGQVHLKKAQVFLIFYVNHGEKRALTWHGTRSCVYKASTKAHFVYLKAAKESVGVTAVGGYDERVWREVVGLSQEEDIIYLLALGVDSGEGEEKRDRSVNAYAHGE